MPRTATTANALLGLLALRPQWSTWELTKQLRRNMRFFWPRAESRIYAEVRELERRRLARAHRSLVGRRARTTYRISRQGRHAVAEWLTTPPGPTHLESEAVLRVLLSDLAAREHVFTALDRLRRDAEDILEVGRVVGPEYVEGTAPFQDQVHLRALLFDFLSHFAFMLREWADRAEREVRTWDSIDADDRARQAVARIEHVLSRYPQPLPHPTPRASAKRS